MFYIRSGGVKLSVLSTAGKEAVVAMLGPGDFFGEGCLAGQPRRMGTATALGPTIVARIGKDEMVRTLHQQPTLSDRFIAHMLARNILTVAASPWGWEMRLRQHTRDILLVTVPDGRPVAIRVAVQERLEAEL